MAHLHGDPSVECTLGEACPHPDRRFWPSPEGQTAPERPRTRGKLSATAAKEVNQVLRWLGVHSRYGPAIGVTDTQARDALALLADQASNGLPGGLDGTDVRRCWPKILAGLKAGHKLRKEVGRYLAMFNGTKELRDAADDFDHATVDLGHRELPLRAATRNLLEAIKRLEAAPGWAIDQPRAEDRQTADAFRLHLEVLEARDAVAELLNAEG